MIQKLDDLNSFHKKKDPWNYNSNPEDKKRLNILLSEIPERNYDNVLDIGCGQGFITKHLPGEKITGVDISHEAIDFAQNHSNDRINFIEGSIFDLNKILDSKYDLIVITGVLYPQYIGSSSSLIYLIINELLEKDGILISVHIEEWYKCQFPFLKLNEMIYSYREYFHKLEIYIK